MVGYMKLSREPRNRSSRSEVYHRGEACRHQNITCNNNFTVDVQNVEYYAEMLETRFAKIFFCPGRQLAKDWPSTRACDDSIWGRIEPTLGRDKSTGYDSGPSWSKSSWTLCERWLLIKIKPYCTQILGDLGYAMESPVWTNIRGWRQENI